MKELLLTAYSLLGDGQGSEWFNNPEYTRAVREMIAYRLPDTSPVDLGSDWAEPFVLGVIYGAGYFSK